MADLTYAEVSKLLKCDPDTGRLFWLTRTPDMFRGEIRQRSCLAWNRRFAEKEAFTSLRHDGYPQGGILGRRFPAHRVIWLLCTGDWPDEHIDHVNGVKTDNRLCNLRQVSSAENNKNQKIPKNNTSGAVGVRWQKRSNKWEASIKVCGKDTYLGSFPDKRDAIAARKIAEAKFGFHPNHGRRM